MGFIHALSNALHKLEKLLAILLCFLILFSLSAGVLYRYVLSAPLTWSDEVAIFSLAWLTFIGGSMGIKRGHAASITLLMDRVHGKVKTILMGMSFFLVLGFVAYLLYLSFVWLSSPNIMVQRSGSMGLPMIIPYLSVPVSFLFITIHTLDHLIRNFGKEELSS